MSILILKTLTVLGLFDNEDDNDPCNKHIGIDLL